MSQGQWKWVKKDVVLPSPKEDKEPEIDEATKKALEEIEKGIGNMRLRLHHTIAYQFIEYDSLKKLWDVLKEKYGVPGLSKAFTEFKAVMSTQISQNQDPCPALDKLMAHFARLKECNMQLEDKIVKMILLAKAPPSMEIVVQIAN
ncbi:hypothetical protein BDM02DRAFT_3105709 [Thelephora ganbajun]|uniref:Uncharacterized protein n=1 Tax=Thelephora ganbajun TaxID=370292 RepID=A0ACB6YZX0_THEGA|nr:hypothetical protein BDM02DRAFT_3105709 [Thelephora ganbajun]